MARKTRFAQLMTMAVAGVAMSLLAVNVHAQRGGAAAGGAAGAAGAPAAGAAAAKKEDPSPLLKLSSGPLENEPAPAAGAAVAPAAGGRGRGGAGSIEANVARAVRSPEVDTKDHKITFRFSAPNAKLVQLQGDFTIHSSTVIDMKNEGNGVWSYTTDSLKPSTYQYWFIVDGQNTPDPSNTYVRPASGVYKSMVDLPGPGSEFMAFRDVPHGAVTEWTYINRDNGTQRKVEVYTPPGYSKSTQSYPVIYLLHGANDYERGWTQSGRANLIMDNAIADGKALPAIIVMPFGHPVTGSLGKQAEIAAVQTSLGVTPSAGGGAIPGASVGGGGGGRGAGGGRGPGGGGAPRGGPGAAPAGGAGGAGPGAAAPTAVPTEVPVAASAAPGAPAAPAAGGRGGRGGGRGGAGGAPGGRGGRGGGPGGGDYMEKDLLTLVMPLVEGEYRVIKDANHRAIIGYSMGGGQASSIGLGHPELFSYVGMYSGGGGGANLAGIADPAKANQTYKWIWIGVGGDDTTALNGSRNADAQLTQRGVNHYYVELPGYHHDYQVWRLFLAANLPVLFRD